MTSHVRVYSAEISRLCVRSHLCQFSCFLPYVSAFYASLLVFIDIQDSRHYNVELPRGKGHITRLCLIMAAFGATSRPVSHYNSLFLALLIIRIIV